MSLSFTVYLERFELAKVFRISRGAKTCAEVVTLVLRDGNKVGWGEAVPYSRYGETSDSVKQTLMTLQGQLKTIDDVQAHLAVMPAGSARNALDCALWDLKARLHNEPVSSMLSLTPCETAITAQTLSIDTPQAMAKEAQHLSDAPLIKVKLDDQLVVERMAAVHKACPDAQFIVDANEAWDMALLKQVAAPLSKLNVVLIEQPLPAGQDDALQDFCSPVALCADESCHTSDNIEWLKTRYHAVNIKLDKTGGLSEAVKLASLAEQHGLHIMLGCMVGSSLAMAPVFLLSAMARYIDLDGPLLVARDRQQGFTFSQGVMQTHDKLLWGLPMPAQALSEY